MTFDMYVCLTDSIASGGNFVLKCKSGVYLIGIFQGFIVSYVYRKVNRENGFVSYLRGYCVSVGGDFWFTRYLT